MTNILLVENNRGDAILAKLEMEKMGYSSDHVDHAESIDQAKKFLELKTYDVIFIDYFVGTDNGTDLLPFINKDKTNVILLSGINNLDELRGRFKDVDVAIQKPLRQEKIQAWVEERQIEERVERRLKKKLRMICIAFWSVVSTIVTSIGMILGQYSESIKIGIKATIEHWIRQ